MHEARYFFNIKSGSTDSLAADGCFFNSPERARSHIQFVRALARRKTRL